MTTEQTPQTTESIPEELISIPWVKYAPIKKPPEKGHWISEPSRKGVRTRIWVPRGTPNIRVLTEKDGDVTAFLPEIAAKFAFLSRYHSALLEGLVIYKTGTTEEERKIAESRLKIKAPSDPKLLADITPCQFTATDLLSVDTQDYTKFSTIERKFKLRRIITPHMIRTQEIDMNYWSDDMTDIIAEQAKLLGFPGVLFRGKNDRYDNHAHWHRLEFHQY